HQNYAGWPLAEAEGVSPGGRQPVTLTLHAYVRGESELCEGNGQPSISDVRTFDDNAGGDEITSASLRPASPIEVYARKRPRLPSTTSTIEVHTSDRSGSPKLRQSVSAMGSAPAQETLRQASATASIPPIRGLIAAARGCRPRPRARARLVPLTRRTDAPSP